MASLRKSSVFLPSVVAMLVAGILWVLALAALPHLHEEVHNDAGAPAHECAVTLFQHSSIEGAPSVAFVSAPVFREIPSVDPIRSSEVAAVFLLSGVLEHAPPLLS